MKKDSTGYAAIRPAWDTRDCSVRALAVSTGVGYETASAAFSAQGRVLKKGTPRTLSENFYENVLGMKRVTMAEGMRLEAFLMVARSGSFLVHKKGHAFAVVEGVVCDWEGTRTSHAGTMLEQVWKVTDLARGKMRKMEELMKELGA